jgi:GT2 family glycosyltransferase/glycosyltransferase involved in cell wall biosynthesis
MSKTSIIILTFNNLDYTRLCLDSIYSKTDTPEFEVIVVDNASTDGTPEFLREHAETKPNLKLILNSINQGFARGNNMGAAAAAGDNLVFLNNDVIVTRGWLSALIAYLHDPEVGLVGPVTNSSGNECQIQVDYQGLDGLDEFAERYVNENQGRSFELRMLPFQCVAMRKSVFEEIGPLDERFGIGMFEDDDYALRLARKGYRILCAEDVFIHHWGSVSFSKLDYTDYWALFSANLKKFEDKWGISWVPHTQRPEFIPQQYRQILDGSIYFAGRVNELMGVKAELEGIKKSNGWAFLQSIMRFRRWLIPEKSRREQLFQTIIRSIRGLKLHANKSQPSALSESRAQKAEISDPHKAVLKPQPRSPITQARSGNARVSGEENTWLSARFPWPLVSVILPVHNHADLIEQAACSVLYGSYDHLELIIIDDGSEDDIEPSLVRLSRNPRVRVYRQPNQKLPRALTHGHQLARGELITWVSADNLMAENAIESMVQALLANPESVMVYADVSIINEEGEPLVDGSYRPQNLDPFCAGVVRLHQNTRPLGFELDNYINACFLYRREAVLALECRFADDLRGMEDYDFWLRLQKCGKIMHIRNETPLYYYRVHKRTMSHDLLSKESDSHLRRGGKLIEFEANRRAYAEQRWSLLLDEKLLPDKKDQISELAVHLPVNKESPRSQITAGTKLLRFVPNSETLSDPVYVRVYPDFWQLAWMASTSDEWKTLDIWSGIDISPLALKAREYQPKLDLFPQAKGRSVFGCHIGLREYPLDLVKVRQYIDRNPWAYFVFVDLPGLDRPDLGQELVSELENALYLGSLPFGNSYMQYAGFDWVWVPPLVESTQTAVYRSQLVLAYAIARPLIAPRALNFEVAPYQLYYRDMDRSLDFVNDYDRSILDPDLLDLYLESWSPVSRLDWLLRLANGVTQDRSICRPNFGLESLVETPPIEWKPTVKKDDGPLKCALVADILDKGGVEEIIANLARRLPEYGFDPFVLCVSSGGMIADKLIAEGIRVYIANGQQAAIRNILHKEKPALASTHWAHLGFLQVAGEFGLPVVETVHNAYVWLDSYGWRQEMQRSRYFSGAVAVSELVRQYYIKWNMVYNPNWISVLPNSIDTNRLEMKDYDIARRELGIRDGEFLFLSLASYDGRKNQLGLEFAFDQVARKYPQARLFCVGQIGDTDYHADVVSFRDTLKSKASIELFEHRSDIGLLLSGADSLVINSFFEGWSLAATEALTAGVPLIHSECGSAHELVGENGARGILIPNPAGDPLELTWDMVQRAIPLKQHRSTPALVEAMSEMIIHREEWNARRSSIRSYALSAFGMKTFLHRYSELFYQVIGKRG